MYIITMNNEALYKYNLRKFLVLDKIYSNMEKKYGETLTKEAIQRKFKNIFYLCIKRKKIHQ